MVKRSKLLALVVAGALAATSLVGCSGGSSSGSGDSTGDGDKKTLTVWSHFTEAEVDEFEKVAKTWGEENNVEVNVVLDQGEIGQLIQAAQSENGPDLVLGIAHDNLGSFERAGILSAVPEGFLDDSWFTSESVLDAVTIDGTRYAVPMAQETTTIIVNKDLVPTLPTTMEELVEMAKEVGFEYDINNFYFSQAFLSAGGGYVFKDNDGTLDPKDIGLNNTGAVAGLEFISSLVNEHKLMTADMTADIAGADFNAGTIGFILSGPWVIGDAVEAGINVEVIPMPTLNGNAPSSFLGVQSSFVVEGSKNKDLAWDLMKTFLDSSQDIVYNAGSRIPVKAGYDVKEDTTKGFMAQAEVATPMPNIPEVNALWDPTKNNLTALTSGTIDAKTAGDNIVSQFKEGIAQLK